LEIREFQKLIWRIYNHHDSRRGVFKTFEWLKSEVAELENAIKHGDLNEVKSELADVLAWLSSVASLLGVDLEDAAVGKYGNGCPKCHSIPCKCKYRENPNN